jgi:HopA1 effector protein family
MTLAATAEAVHGIRITDRTRFTWLGRRSPGLSTRAEGAMPDALARRYLVATIANRLYQDLYVSGGPRPVTPPQDRSGPDIALRSSLLEANGGTGPWQGGWQLVGHENGAWRVARDGFTMLAEREACRAANGDEADGLREGTEVRLHLPKELPGFSPGFHMVLGNLPWPDARPEAGVRCYWNLRAEGAAPFVRSATEALNDAGVPFRLKVAEHPSLYDRCDAGVLYMPAASVEAAREPVFAVHGAVVRWMDPGVPAWTARVGHGIAVAEDPGGRSFGQSRCEAVAEGLVQAHELGLRSFADRVTVVADAIRAAGIDTDRPYAQAGSEGLLAAFELN